MTIDFGRTAADYARHRAGFPEAFFERLLRDEVSAGDRVLDIGSGTGTVARGLALRGCRVTALDPSAELLAQARDLDAQAGVDVLQVVSRVEDAHFTPESFEVVVAGQCWHWFERPEAARRARNWLVPGGRLVIAHFDWLPLAGNMVEDTEALILAWNPGWKMGGGSGLYPAWLKDVREAGFTALRTFSFDLDVPYSHEDWRGRIRASAGVGASLDPEAIKRFDDELATLLAARHGEQPMRVPHRVWALVANA